MSSDDLCSQQWQYAFQTDYYRRHTDHSVPASRKSNSPHGPTSQLQPLNSDRLLDRAHYAASGLLACALAASSAASRQIRQGLELDADFAEMRPGLLLAERLGERIETI